MMQKRVEYDLWYINNWSLWLDIIIMAQTAVVSVRLTNAH
ncbi:lipopolysaccharide/colanic/teichoic acid biosynthesis glycosyltransferase [Bradyrhizobium sp. GM7.3]